MDIDATPQRSYPPVNVEEEHDRVSAESEYVAGIEFMADTTWCISSSFSNIQLYNGAGTRFARATLVGMARPANLLLEPHGDFDPLPSTNGQIQLARASLRISLEAPTSPNHKVFADDFALAVERLKTLASFLPVTKPSLSPFLVEQNGESVVSFYRPLFSKAAFPSGNLQLSRGQGTQLPIGPFPLEAYPIRQDYRTYLDAIVRTHYARRVGVWDRRGVPIPESQRAYFVENNLVEIEFELAYNHKQGLVALFNEITLLH